MILMRNLLGQRSYMEGTPHTKEQVLQTKIIAHRIPCKKGWWKSELRKLHREKNKKKTPKRLIDDQSLWGVWMKRTFLFVVVLQWVERHEVWCSLFHWVQRKELRNRWGIMWYLVSGVFVHSPICLNGQLYPYTSVHRRQCPWEERLH